MRSRTGRWTAGPDAMKDTLALTSVLGFAGGILIASALPLPVPVSAFLILLAAGFFIAWFFGRRDAYLIPACFLLLFAFGMVRTDAVPRALPPTFASSLDAPVALEGVVVTDPDLRESNQRLTVEVREGNAQTRVLAVADRYGRFAVGDLVRVEGTLTTPEPFSTDGGRMFDYRAYLAKDGIFALIPHAHIERTGSSHDFTLRALRILYGAKHAFAAGLEASLPEPYASLAEGLITGGKQGLGQTLLDAFTIAGLLPIVVLSGYNVMIVANGALAALAFLPKRFALAFASAVVAAFVLAAGGGASALRAGLMAGLALFAKSTRRTYDALRALIAVFVLMLLANPLSLAYDPGFQFSFAAALGLILLSTPLMGKLRFIRAAWLRDIVATTLSAQLFVLPLLLYETGNLSLVSIPANVLALPAVPLAMALSALAGLAGMVLPAVAPFAGLPAYGVLAYIVGVAETLARIPVAHLIIPAFSAAFLLPLYGLVAWLTLHIRKTAPEGAVVGGAKA